jgi:hypothetical protein
MVPDRVCFQIEVKRKSLGLFLQLVGYTISDTPISYHEVWIPPTREMIDLARVWASEPGN